MIFRRLVAFVLVLQMAIFTPGISLASAPVAVQRAPFEDVLKTYRFQLEQPQADREALLKSFSGDLLDQGYTPDDLNAFVQKQLSKKEHANFQKFMQISLAGIDPATLTAEEFSGVVEQALIATQPKGLTWSSCSTRTAGIIIGIAAVVLGVIAIVKKKLDLITKEKLDEIHAKKSGEIHFKYNDTNQKLDDPNGYFNGKIDGSLNRIDSNDAKIREAESKISSNEYALAWGCSSTLDEDEADRCYDQMESMRNENANLRERISNLQRDSINEFKNIRFYETEKIRYQDPAVITAERAEIELWYPGAVQTENERYQLDLAEMPGKNEELSEKNEEIRRTKRTLGILAGVGGAASLAMILSSRHASCGGQQPSLK